MSNYATLHDEIEGGFYPDAPVSLRQAALSLAEAVDDKNDNGALWDKYLTALRELRATNDQHIDPQDEFGQRLQQIASEVSGAIRDKT